MNRRRFLSTAASSAAVLACAPRMFAAAANYDLVIKGTRAARSLRLVSSTFTLIAGAPARARHWSCRTA